MAKTEEKSKKKPARPKKGLHGWKAALTVFGCGTLAAFGVFGVVISLFGAFLSTISSEFSASGEVDGGSGVTQTTKPREEFEEDKFDLCKISLPAISDISLRLDEVSEFPVDTSIDGGAPTAEDLVRSDECSGVLHPTAVAPEPWQFNFFYQAVIYSPDQDEDEIAQNKAEEILSQNEGVETGHVDFLDESRYVHSSSENGSEYMVVARKRSAVIEITMTSSIDNSELDFANELRKMDGHLDISLNNLIPE